MNRFEVGQLAQVGPYRFRVLACVTYGNNDGQWDEWYLELPDGGTGWLEEEDGQTFLTRKHQLIIGVPAYENIRIGQTLPLSGQDFFVVEKCSAEVMEVTGSLPFALSPGDTLKFVDGIIRGAPASLEYNDEGIELVVGEVLET